ncbi:MAG: GDP-mannose 4,6-dehydratase [Chloroflexota bacterium]|nr:GDP-mannose 4,6-dehydratase [Chloroflexota bacterium]
MRVLATGGAGFIGSHVVDSLVQRGDDVIVIDDLSTGSLGNVNPRAGFYQMSITDPALGEVFAREKPDMVSHHAAQVNLRRSVDEPQFDAEVNIIGSLNVMANCVRYGVRKLVYSSSGGAVYGEPQYLPVDENHPVNPVSQYGVSKHAVEHYLQCYAQYGLEYVSLRYPNVYGARQNPGGEAGVIAIFACQMLRGERPTIFGAGDKTRDYTHVSDIVAVHLLAMERGHNAVYNVGTGVETSDQEIFDAVAEAMGYRDTPVYETVRPGEIQRICLDWTRARGELGWSPRLSLREGIELTVPYYKSQGAQG